jgi:hypothetical protein
VLSRHKKSRMYHWSIEEVEALSTNAIVRKLIDFGVGFRRKQFLVDVRRFYSAEELSDHWVSVFPITAVKFDRDFIWMAAMVLWRRLAPDVVTSELLDEMMQRGYDLKDEGRLKEYCNLWLEVWEHLKKRFTSDMSGIEDVDLGVFTGIPLYNWCQDAVIVNRGKYGRAKEISLSVPEEFVQTLLFEDHKLKALSDIWVKVEETS